MRPDRPMLLEIKRLQQLAGIIEIKIQTPLGINPKEVEANFREEWEQLCHKASGLPVDLDDFWYELQEKYIEKYPQLKSQIERY